MTREEKRAKLILFRSQLETTSDSVNSLIHTDTFDDLSNIQKIKILSAEIELKSLVKELKKL